MSFSIGSIGIPPRIPEITAPSSGSGSAAEGSFKEALTEAISNVEEYRKTAETGVQQFLTGQREDLHNVALETQRAEMAFELFLQTRNKVVQAYQEVMRTQV
jgi:flagellar hook-basal body complex protein FliE